MTVLRHVLREMLFTFVVTGGILMGVALVGGAFAVGRSAPGLGVEFYLSVLLSTAGIVAPHVAVVSLVVSATLTMARMSADRELELVRAAGVPAGALVLPLLLVGVVLCGVVGAFTLYVTPRGFALQRAVLKEAAISILRNPPPGRQEFRFGSTRLMYQHVENGWLQKPFITQRDIPTGELLQWITADRASVEFRGAMVPVMLLENVNYGQRTEGGEHVGHARAMEFTLDLADALSRPVGVAGEPTGVVWRAAHEEQEPHRRTRALAQVHGRVAGALAPLGLTFLAAACGLGITRAHRLAGLGMTIPTLTAYYALLYFFTGLSERGKLAPNLGPYFLVGFTLVPGAVLLWAKLRR